MNLMKLPLHWQIIIGMVLGIVWALISSSLGWSQFTLNWINPFGTIFINLLKLIAVPLVLFSVIKGIAGLGDVAKLGQMGAKTLLLYLASTIIAVSLGLGLANFIKPGTLIDNSQRIDNRISYELWAKETGNDQYIDEHKSFLSNSDYAYRIEDAKKRNALQSQNTEVGEKIEKAKNTKERGPLQFLVEMIPENVLLSLSNNSLMLQIIFFAIFFGITMLYLPATSAKPLAAVIGSLNDVFLKMVDLVMKGAPFFVFALLAGKLSEMAGDNPSGVIEIFKGLSWYSLVVFSGLAIMVFIIYPLIYSSFVKDKTYFDFFRGIGAAQMLAFSTSSSAATLPLTMECVHEKMGVREEVSSFVLPIGATVNMDGTSMYQAIAVIFLAQFHMVDLSLSQQLVIVLTATLASIGSAAVPSAGLIMLIIVLEGVGLNPAWIAIIFPVDRILDMCRTVVNVSGDATVASLVNDMQKEVKS